MTDSDEPRTSTPFARAPSTVHRTTTFLLGDVVASEHDGVVVGWVAMSHLHAGDGDQLAGLLDPDHISEPHAVHRATHGDRA
jgi:hypothetical protein